MELIRTIYDIEKISVLIKLVNVYCPNDRLCGLVVRVSGYKSSTNYFTLFLL
jgi:hypothetical protein